MAATTTITFKHSHSEYLKNTINTIPLKSYVEKSPPIFNAYYESNITTIDKIAFIYFIGSIYTNKINGTDIIFADNLPIKFKSGQKISTMCQINNYSAPSTAPSVFFDTLELTCSGNTMIYEKATLSLIEYFNSFYESVLYVRCFDQIAFIE